MLRAANPDMDFLPVLWRVASERIRRRTYASDRLRHFVLRSAAREPEDAGWSPYQGEMSMNGQEERYVRSNDTAARVIAYLSPYLFWAVMGAIVGGIMLLQ